MDPKNYQRSGFSHSQVTSHNKQKPERPRMLNTSQGHRQMKNEQDEYESWDRHFSSQSYTMYNFFEKEHHV